MVFRFFSFFTVFKKTYIKEVRNIILRYLFKGKEILFPKVFVEFGSQPGLRDNVF